ncbi:hypothetical protein ACHAWO_002112 [Cyclotella atomus]|uniref:Sulfotransferase domain-containing protein n=1 Tax=Cyclotella atomus TaxID=382360 RepID=A0ABD3P1U5_9STRA
MNNGTILSRLRVTLMVAICLMSFMQFFFLHLHGTDRDDLYPKYPRLDDPVSQASNKVTGLADSTPIQTRRLRLDYTNSRDAPLYTALTNSTNLTFCGSCPYNILITCSERVDELMDKYRLTRFDAQNELLANCGIDYLNEPYVLLHVGPHKTGTTSIQEFLYNSLESNSTSYLDEDNFAIPTYTQLPGWFKGHGAMLNFAHCMIKNYRGDGGRVSAGKCNELRQIFPKFLREAYNQSKNVLIVAEDLDRLEIDYVRTLYWLQPYRRIRVAVCYRRLHHWLPSFYNQIVKMYTPKYIRGDYPYPSFVEWIDEKYHHFKQVHSIQVANRYRSSNKFESVSMMNLHSEINLIEDFFCNYVPHANATCEFIKRKNATDERISNQGYNHDFERLATEAFRAGKLNHYHHAIANKMAKKLEALMPDARAYPKKCLNQTFLDELLQLEHDIEKTHFKEWYDGQGGEAGLKEDFENSKALYCSMNTEFIMNNGMFDRLFDELNKAKK